MRVQLPEWIAGAFAKACRRFQLEWSGKELLEPLPATIGKRHGPTDPPLAEVVQKARIRAQEPASAPIDPPPTRRTPRPKRQRPAKTPPIEPLAPLSTAQLQQRAQDKVDRILEQTRQDVDRELVERKERRVAGRITPAVERRQEGSDRRHRAPNGKTCPNCHERVGPRTIECMCGHRFEPKK